MVLHCFPFFEFSVTGRGWRGGGWRGGGHDDVVPSVCQKCFMMLVKVG